MCSRHALRHSRLATPELPTVLFAKIAASGLLYHSFQTGSCKTLSIASATPSWSFVAANFQPRSCAISTRSRSAIRHHHRIPRELQHLQVVVIIADGHNLLAARCPATPPACAARRPLSSPAAEYPESSNPAADTPSGAPRSSGRNSLALRTASASAIAASVPQTIPCTGASPSSKARSSG